MAAIFWLVGLLQVSHCAWPEPTSSSSYPMVAAGDEGFVVAWQSGSPASAIKVARIH